MLVISQASVGKPESKNASRSSSSYGGHGPRRSKRSARKPLRENVVAETNNSDVEKSKNRLKQNLEDEANNMQLYKEDTQREISNNNDNFGEN